MRQIKFVAGFVLLIGFMFASTGTADATPVEILSGFIAANSSRTWDTTIGFTLSDGRTFFETTPLPFAYPIGTGLEGNQNTVYVGIWGQPNFATQFTFYHEPISQPLRGPDINSVRFTMIGTLTTYSVFYDDGVRTLINPVTEDVIGQGAIRRFWTKDFPTTEYFNQGIEYDFDVPEASSVVLLGIALAIISIKFRNCSGRNSESLS